MSTVEEQSGAARHRGADPQGHRDHRRNAGPPAVVLGQAGQQGRGPRAARRGLPAPARRRPVRPAGCSRSARSTWPRCSARATTSSRPPVCRPSGWCSGPRSSARPSRRRAGSSKTARDEARRLRLEAEDYCDQKLAAFEVVLDRTIKTVAAGREKLSVTPPPIFDGPDTRRRREWSADDTPGRARTPSSIRIGPRDGDDEPIPWLVPGDDLCAGRRTPAARGAPSGPVGELAVAGSVVPGGSPATAVADARLRGRAASR